MKSDLVNRLTDQADEHASDYVTDLLQRGVQVLPEYYEQAFRKKFAELIVRECYHWAKENGGIGDDNDYNELKQHFGILGKSL